MYEIFERREVQGVKERIARLAKGMVEYNIPELEISENTLSKTIENRKYAGSFEVYNEGNYEMKGLVYTTNDAIRLIDNQFVGKRAKIRYEILADRYEVGDLIQGRINVVSNCGESYINVEVKVQGKCVHTSVGDINNLFHFVNLVKQDYDAALKLFGSPEFAECFLKDDLASKSMYEGLVRNRDKREAMEEFIVGIRKKQAVELSVDKEGASYEKIGDNVSKNVRVTRSGWGYLQAEVCARGSFLILEKNSISDEEFGGHVYEYQYIIDASKLHGGCNEGAIEFCYRDTVISYPVTVNQPRRADANHIALRKCFIELEQKYLEFRLRGSNTERWAEDSLKILERARSYDDRNIFLKLYQAQVCLVRKREKDAAWLLDSVAEEITGSKRENPELYCYYLYVRSMQKKELDFTLRVLEAVKEIYNNGCNSWRILWILFYIDSSYENNKSMKLARIKECFNNGCTSPIMLYEALYVLNRQPQLLRVVNHFELLVLKFAAERKVADLKLAICLAEIVERGREFHPQLLRVLIQFYEKFENRTLLNAIVIYLIRGNKRGEEYFKWYHLAIRAGIRVRGLFEYYIFSMPEDYSKAIPEEVLMYFVANAGTLKEKQAQYYTRIIEMKERYSGIYKHYLKPMEDFAMLRAREGEIDDDLACIYREVLNERLITEENKMSLLMILNTWKVTVHSERAKQVIVIHKETKDEQIYKIKDHVAYVRIFTEDAIVLFSDGYGRRFLNTVEYSMDKMFDNRAMENAIVKQMPDYVYLQLKQCEQALKYQKNILGGIRIFKNIIMNSQNKEDTKPMVSVREEYGLGIVGDVIDYYCNRDSGEETDVFLKEIEIGKLTRRRRVQVMELMILRGMYQEVTKIIREYGISGLDTRRMVKYCSRVLPGYEDECYTELVEDCYYAFADGKYTDEMLQYLVKYYNGTTREMIELWKAAKNAELPVRALEERLIAQMLFTRTHLKSIAVIFDSYRRCAPYKMLKDAYLFYMSYTYFVMEKKVDDLFFVQLEDELSECESGTDIQNCAYLRHQSEQSEISDISVNICNHAIKELERRHICFNFFHRLKEKMKLPGSINNSTVIEYRTNPDAGVMITYQLDGSREEKTEEMIQVFPGLFIKAFVLFYGETLQYFITEAIDGKMNQTESHNFKQDDRSVEVSETRFGMLNEILQYMDLQQESDAAERIKEYYHMLHMTKELF